MILKKKKEYPYDQEYRTATRFAWHPKYEFDNSLPSDREYGDLFWLEKYIVTYRFNGPQKKWYKKKIERYVDAVMNGLKS